MRGVLRIDELIVQILRNDFAVLERGEAWLHGYGVDRFWFRINAVDVHDHLVRAIDLEFRRNLHIDLPAAGVKDGLAGEQLFQAIFMFKRPICLCPNNNKWFQAISGFRLDIRGPLKENNSTDCTRVLMPLGASRRRASRGVNGYWTFRASDSTLAQGWRGI